VDNVLANHVCPGAGRCGDRKGAGMGRYFFYILEIKSREEQCEIVWIHYIIYGCLQGNEKSRQVEEEGIKNRFIFM